MAFDHVFVRLNFTTAYEWKTMFILRLFSIPELYLIQLHLYSSVT